MLSIEQQVKRFNIYYMKRKLGVVSVFSVCAVVSLDEVDRVGACLLPQVNVFGANGLTRHRRL